MQLYGAIFNSNNSRWDENFFTWFVAFESQHLSNFLWKIKATARYEHGKFLGFFQLFLTSRCLYENAIDVISDH